MNKIIWNYISQARDFWGWVSFGIEMVIVAAVLIYCLIFLLRHGKKIYILLGLLTYIILFTIAYLLKLLILEWVLYISLVMIFIMLVVYFAPEIKVMLNTKVKIKAPKQFLTNKETKEELINTLVKTVSHLSSRKVGAIITIEKEHTLNVYIDKAIRLDAIVTFELLDTIFHPNTALHDGAVIIRGNQIMCAGAFYPSSDKSDIPQQYGSRHRAAIGISEVTDAFTIVVSEETGHVATTIGGTITGNVTIEMLRLSLNQHIIVQ